MSIKDNAAFQARSLVSTGIRFCFILPNAKTKALHSSARSFGSRISLLHTISESTPSAGRKTPFENTKGRSWERGKHRISYTKDWRSYRPWGCVNSFTFQESASEAYIGLGYHYNASALHKWRHWGLILEKIVRRIFPETTVANCCRAVKRDKPSSANSINWTD